MTQVTIGFYVGTFVYALLVLRAVGSFSDADFIPRLSITLASLLGIAAVVLLVVFLNHVSLMIQVSHVTARIAHDTLARVEVLYPERYGEAVDGQDGADLLASWRSQPPGRVLPRRPGYVQRVGLDYVGERLAERTERVAILVCPGDFVSVDTPIAETWPAGADDCRGELLDAVTIASERDLDQDVDFGLRQLADTALKAMSPGIADPATAVTCIGYLRAILVRVTERASPSAVRSFSEGGPTVVVRRRRYTEYLESVLQVNRYVAGDAWVIGELLSALGACAQAAERCGASARAGAVREAAATIAEQAGREVKNDRDRRSVEGLMRARGLSER